MTSFQRKTKKYAKISVEVIGFLFRNEENLYRWSKPKKFN